jgi:hypothetical protein
MSKARKELPKVKRRKSQLKFLKLQKSNQEVLKKLEKVFC